MRRLVIEQTNWGQYRASNTEGKRAVGVTLESALSKLLEGTGCPQELVYSACEVVESALGEDRAGPQGQIHEGVVSA